MVLADKEQDEYNGLSLQECKMLHQPVGMKKLYEH
jgi:hypothetical protein